MTALLPVAGPGGTAAFITWGWRRGWTMAALLATLAVCLFLPALATALLAAAGMSGTTRATLPRALAAALALTALTATGLSPAGQRNQQGQAHAERQLNLFLLHFASHSIEYPRVHS